VSLARLLVVACTVALVGCGSGGGSGQGQIPPAARALAAKGARHGRPAAVPRAPARLEIPGGSGYLAAMATQAGFTLRDRPNGRALVHLSPQTEYGSPTVVWASERRGRWLGVVTPALSNGQLGWLDVDRARPVMWRSPYKLVAQLTERTVILKRGARVLRTIPVTIGRPDTPTPIGRFEVTDKLLTPPGTAYGCCILALSGHQPNLRPGWAGGDRIAIHGSPSQLVGAAASAGCLRARDKDLRVLMRLVPLGTPVLITL
jgi:L,D-transpeptidase catalytic domain